MKALSTALVSPFLGQGLPVSSMSVALSARPEVRPFPEKLSQMLRPSAFLP